jgi:hypothetical protein
MGPTTIVTPPPPAIGVETAQEPAPSASKEPIRQAPSPATPRTKRPPLVRRKILALIAILSVPFIVMYVGVVGEIDVLLNIGGGLMMIMLAVATLAQLFGLELD